MGIGLMPHIPDDLILGQVKDIVQSHGKLHSSQIGSQMSPCSAQMFQQKFPDLLCKLREILRRDLLDIIFFFYLL